jgi:hypothetical protein
VEICSYRRVFALERRIYRIDQLRLNPGGVPVRGIVYSLVAVGVALACTRLPILSVLAGPVPWFLRDVALPLACGALLTVASIDGRRFEHAAGALLNYTLTARTPILLRAPRSARARPRWHAPDLLMLPDGSDHRLRRLRFTGPGVAHVLAPHECRRTGRVAALRMRRRALVAVRAAQAGERAAGRVIVLDGNLTRAIR